MFCTMLRCSRAPWPIASKLSELGKLGRQRSFSTTPPPAAAAETDPRVIFSGIQPTGEVHLGNYLGAISHWLTLQGTAKEHTFFSVVDLHAITLPQDPSVLREGSRKMACTLLASGLDPEKCSLFIQSHFPQHTELAWILGCSAPFHLLNTMTQFKDKSQNQKKDGVHLGLFSYPVLMTADILLYKTTHVPVGDDQTQHLELAAKLARGFNHRFQPGFFPVPSAINDSRGGVRRVMSLKDGTKKMSKSDPSALTRINLTDTADEIKLKIDKAKTDSEPGWTYDPANRPEAANLLNIFSALSGRTVEDLLGEFGEAKRIPFKAALTEVLVERICPIGEEMQRLTKDPGYVDDVLAKGADQAKSVAAKNIDEIKTLVGLG
jgi:tryptophanyl-tRNA synthetase